MDVPAFCDTCGAVFRSGIVVENSKHIAFVGNTAGPCPVCGGRGHIPDGVFNFVGNTIEILSAPQRTREELSRLAAILRNAQEKKQAPAVVAQTIRKEVPEFSGLADLLPKTREELYAFLALIVAALTLLIQGGGDGNRTSNITVNQTINQVFVETEKSAKTHESKNAPAEAAPTGGGNDPSSSANGDKGADGGGDGRD